MKGSSYIAQSLIMLLMIQFVHLSTIKVPFDLPRVLSEEFNDKDNTVEINLNINLDVDDIVDSNDIDVQENNTSSGIFHLLPRQSTGSKNRTCGFEGGDCCRNELPSEERLSTKLEIDCGPGLTCALMDPSPYAPGKCEPTRNHDSTPKQEGEKCGFSFECDEGLECKVVNKANKFGFPTQKCIKKEEPVPTPRECCEASNVPEFCLGLCSPADAMSRQENRPTACSKYETTIDKCFQASEGGLQESCREAGKYCHATLLDENIGGCCDGLECLVDYHPNNAIGTKKCKEVNFGLPPTYLSIEGHKDCMGSRDMGDFTVACLYQIQPANCKDVAWSWLKQFTGSEKIPACNENETGIETNEESKELHILDALMGKAPCWYTASGCITTKDIKH